MKPLGKALKAAFYNRDNAQHALDELLKAYRSTPHPATKVTPGDIIFRHGYRSDFPRAPAISKEATMEARDRDAEQKQEREEKVNKSKKRVPMRIEVGDLVLLKAYPKGRKFQPVYNEEVHEVIELEEKGVVVRDSEGKQKRRHKDDIKLYHGDSDMPSASCSNAVIPQDKEEEVTGIMDETEVEVLREGGQTEGQVEETRTLAEGELEAEVEVVQPGGEGQGTPAGAMRAQRNRTLPGKFKDFDMNRVRGAV